MNNSNLSVSYGLDLWPLANGLMIYGWCIMKVGFLQSPSKNRPTSLSSNLAMVSGGLQGILCTIHRPYNKVLNSSDSMSSGNTTPNLSWRLDIMSILLNGVEKSISITSSLSLPLGLYLMIYVPNNYNTI